MKADDIERLWNTTKRPGDPWDMPEWRLQSSNGRELLERFARACEQHGIDQAQRFAEVSESDGWHKTEPYIDWTRLEAEIAKENEDG